MGLCNDEIKPCKSNTSETQKENLAQNLAFLVQKHPDLAEIVQVWPDLPEHIKAAIKALAGLTDEQKCKQ